MDKLPPKGRIEAGVHPHDLWICRCGEDLYVTRSGQFVFCKVCDSGDAVPSEPSEEQAQ
jgi:hypothetical protein